MSREQGPREAGMRASATESWIPAFAGMSTVTFGYRPGLLFPQITTFPTQTTYQR